MCEGGEFGFGVVDAKLELSCEYLGGIHIATQGTLALPECVGVFG